MSTTSIFKAFRKKKKQRQKKKNNNNNKYETHTRTHTHKTDETTHKVWHAATLVVLLFVSWTVVAKMIFRYDLKRKKMLISVNITLYFTLGVFINSKRTMQCQCALASISAVLYFQSHEKRWIRIQKKCELLSKVSIKLNKASNS